MPGRGRRRGKVSQTAEGNRDQRRRRRRRMRILEMKVFLKDSCLLGEFPPEQGKRERRKGW